MSHQQAAPIQLPPPQDRELTLEELARCNGDGYRVPIYVSLKGTVFDVSSKPEVYGPGRSYHVFVGKDPSKAIGMSTIRPEHAVSDYGSLTPYQLTILDGWYKMFEDKYPIIGRVVDLPPHAPRPPTPEAPAAKSPSTKSSGGLRSFFSSKGKGEDQTPKPSAAPSVVALPDLKGKGKATDVELPDPAAFDTKDLKDSLPLPATASSKGKEKAI